MELLICKDSEDLITSTSRWCEKRIQHHQARAMYLPAGSTPIPLYQSWTIAPPRFLKDLKLLQIDDVLTGPRAGMFKDFFNQHLPKLVGQFSWIQEKYEQGDLAILGLGLNGHIAFHEPGLPMNFNCGCVRLNEKTCQTLSVSANTWGISYGVGAFLKTKAILMLVTGSSKSEILKKLIAEDPTVPASWLCQHPDFTILADREAIA